MARERPNPPGNAPVASLEAKDEVDELMDQGVGAFTGDDGEGDYGEGGLEDFEDELATEMDLGQYDLTQAVGLDLRPLKTGFWYPALCVAAQSGNSGNGNPQITVTVQVTGDGFNNNGEKHTVSDGAPVTGITVQDQLPTPRPPLTPKKVNSLYKLKRFAGACGLAILDENGNPVKVKPGVKANDFVGSALFFKCEVDTQYNPDKPRNKVEFGQYLPPSKFKQRAGAGATTGK